MTEPMAAASALVEPDMPEKKIIAVAGATGSQGGGLTRAILADPSGGFAVRALTRDVNSDKAKALAKAGAEVVAANVDGSISRPSAKNRRRTTWRSRPRTRG